LHYSDTDNLGEAFVVAPRLGVALPMGESTSLWLRGGLTYSKQKFSLLGSTTMTFVMPAADALLVLSPVEHFAFTLGALAEVSAYGKVKAEAPEWLGPASESEIDASARNLGVVFGALASF